MRAKMAGARASADALRAACRRAAQRHTPLAAVVPGVHAVGAPRAGVPLPGRMIRDRARAPLSRAPLARAHRAGEGARALFGWLQGRAPPPPEAPVGTGPDAYAWLQHGDERRIRRYLEAENKYARAALRPVRKLERALLQAMSGRLDDHEHGEPEVVCVCARAVLRAAVRRSAPAALHRSRLALRHGCRLGRGR